MIFKKIASIFDWIATMSKNLLGFITAPIIYPILYPFRNDPDIRGKKPFWYYFDDEDGDYGTDWFRESLPYGNKTDKWSLFKTAYKWSALRNPAWNLQASLVPNNKGEQTIISSKGKLIKNGEEQSPLVFAGFKYINLNGDYKDNRGDFLSIKHSTFGKMFTWYESGGRLFWRLSYANNIFSKLWIEFHIGTNNYRYTFRLKFKWNLIKL